MMKILKKLLMGVAGLVMVSAASAQVYGVTSLGVSQWAGDDVDTVCEGITCDKTDVAFKLVAGYKLNSLFAVEAGYHNFGKLKADNNGVVTETKASGFGGGVALHLEFTQNLYGIGRAGLMYVTTEAGNVDDSNAAVYGGIGLAYNFTPNFGLEGGWDFTQAKLDDDGADFKATVHAFTIGARFSF